MLLGHQTGVSGQDSVTDPFLYVEEQQHHGHLMRFVRPPQQVTGRQPLNMQLPTSLQPIPASQLRSELSQFFFEDELTMDLLQSTHINNDQYSAKSAPALSQQVICNMDHALINTELLESGDQAGGMGTHDGIVGGGLANDQYTTPAHIELDPLYQEIFPDDITRSIALALATKEAQAIPTYNTAGLSSVLMEGDPDLSSVDMQYTGKAASLILKDDVPAARGKRLRAPDWTVREKHVYLLLRVEALGKVKGKDWDYVSQELEERYGFHRSPRSCEDLWGGLLKAYRAVRDYEAENVHEHLPDSWTMNFVGESKGSSCYWEMSADERSRNKLPRVFFLEWSKMMERILAAKEKRSRLKSSGDAIFPPDVPLWISPLGKLLSDQKILGWYGSATIVAMMKDTFRQALHTLESDLQTQKEEERIFDKKWQALEKKKRALEREELALMKRQRVGQYLHTQGRFRLPTGQKGWKKSWQPPSSPSKLPSHQPPAAI